MASGKSNKNYTIYLPLAGIIIMAAAFFLLDFFVFSGKNTDNADLGADSETAVVRKIQIKNLDTAIFKDQRYLKLKDPKTSLPGISELNPGKANPFKAD